MRALGILLIVVLGFQLRGIPPQEGGAFVYSIERSLTGSAGPWDSIGTTPDNIYNDPIVVLQENDETTRVYYRIRARWVDGAKWGPFSLPVSGAQVDLAPGPGPTDTIATWRPGRKAFYIDPRGGHRELLVIIKPAGSIFEIDWGPPRPLIEALEHVFAVNFWDFNRDGMIDIQDFVIFAQLGWGDSPENVETFGRLYSKPSVFFITIKSSGGMP